MAIFNHPPTEQQLHGMAYRNLAGFGGKRFKNDDQAFNWLSHGVLPQEPKVSVLGVPDLTSAVRYLAQESIYNTPGIATVDTDGPVLQPKAIEFRNPLLAIKNVAMPALFPGNGRLENVVDFAGLTAMQQALQNNLLNFVGVSTSPRPLRRQGQLANYYSNAGALEYIAGMSRKNLIENVEKANNPQIQKFVGILRSVCNEALANILNYWHVFDVYPPISIMAPTDGREGRFAKDVVTLIKQIGVSVPTVTLCQINPATPPAGFVLGFDQNSSLEFKPAFASIT